MVVIAFACFAILVVAWLLAPTGDVGSTAPMTAPALKVGDALT